MNMQIFGDRSVQSDLRRRSITLVRPLINLEKNSPFFLPIGLLTIAAIIREYGHEVEIVDFEFNHRIGTGFKADVPISQFVDALVSHDSTFFGITVLADTLPTALVMGKAIKQARPDAVVVLGGPGVHGTAEAITERFSDCVDFVCLAGAEFAFLEVLERDLKCLAAMPPILRNAPIKGRKRQAIVDLDEIPSPAYDLVDVPAYFELASPRIFDLHAGSGCTYKCSFCTTAPFWNHKFSIRSPAAIFSEMQRLYEKYGITEFNLIHDNFVNVKSYIEEFIAYFCAHNTKFIWGCAVRPDNAPLDLMHRMYKAGCRFLFVGTDAGDPMILRDMKKMTSNEKSYRFFREAREAGMVFETNTIIGYPNENDAALEASVKIIFDAIAAGGYTADVSVLQPLPGAPVTRIHKEQIEPATNVFSTYIPPEAADMIAANPDIFTGFGFIRSSNRDFSYYTKLSDLIRYFTRHYFLSIYFIKEKLGIPYIEIFDVLASENERSYYDRTFISYARDLQGAPSDINLLNSILHYEAGIEFVKGVDVNVELTNIYSRPTQVEEFSRIVVDLAHEVHTMRSCLPEVDSPVRRDVSYFLSRDGDNIVTVKLKDWQRALWEDTKNWQSVYVSEWAGRLSRSKNRSIKDARKAVLSTLTLFGVTTDEKASNGDLAVTHQNRTA